MTDSPLTAEATLKALRPYVKHAIYCFAPGIRGGPKRECICRLDETLAVLATRAKASGEGLRAEACPMCGRRPNKHLREYLADPAPAGLPLNDSNGPWCGCGQPLGHTVPNVDCDPAPAGLDVERLAEALAQAEVNCWANSESGHKITDMDDGTAAHRRDAEAIAAEYARLQPAPLTGETE